MVRLVLRPGHDAVGGAGTQLEMFAKHIIPAFKD